MAPRAPRRKDAGTTKGRPTAPGLEDELLQRYSHAGTALLRDEAPRRLDPALRTEMETITGSNLPDVRLHSGPEARRMAATLGARAFTTGPSDVFFGGGQLDIGSPKGKSLLAHELTHVAEGNSGMARVPRLPQREQLEIRARRVEEMVLAREQTAIRAAPETPSDPVRVTMPGSTDATSPTAGGLAIDKAALEERIWQRLERDMKRLRERTGHL